MAWKSGWQTSKQDGSRMVSVASIGLPISCSCEFGAAALDLKKVERK